MRKSLGEWGRTRWPLSLWRWHAYREIGCQGHEVTMVTVMLVREGVLMTVFLNVSETSHFEAEYVTLMCNQKGAKMTFP